MKNNETKIYEIILKKDDELQSIITIKAESFPNAYGVANRARCELDDGYRIVKIKERIIENK